MSDPSENSLRADLESGFAADAGNDTPPGLDSGAPPVANAGEPPAVELPALEAPAMWGPKYKESFSALAGLPNARAHLEAWVNQWKETQGHITKRDQEFAEYRKQFDPIRETLSPYEQYWQMQGMTPQQGISQLLGWGQALAQNPREALMRLSKIYNVDLREAMAEQPYVDPQVEALQKKLAQFEQQQQQQQLYGQREQQNRVLEQLKAFESATDEQGQLKHPYYSRVFDQMIGLSRGGLAQTIEEAYAKAVALNPEIQAEIAEGKKAAEAAARAAEAKKAAEASRTVKSKATDGMPKSTGRSLRQELEAAAAATGFD